MPLEIDMVIVTADVINRDGKIYTESAILDLLKKYKGDSRIYYDKDKKELHYKGALNGWVSLFAGIKLEG